MVSERWSLTTMLDGVYKRTVWQTQEGAIADRDRLLRPRRVRDMNFPTNYRTIWPLGWTAISRTHERALPMTKMTPKYYRRARERAQALARRKVEKTKREIIEILLRAGYDIQEDKLEKEK